MHRREACAPNKSVGAPSDLHRIRGLPNFLQQGGDRIRAELRGMKCGGWKTAQRVRNLPGVEGAKLRDGFPGDHVRKDGTRRDRRYAALRFESRHCKFAVLKTYSEMQNVPANRIGDVDSCGRLRQISRVMRITKMFEDGIVKQTTLALRKSTLEAHERTTSRTGRNFQYNSRRATLIVDSRICKGVSQIVRLLVQTD
jgi:hypothetical protein